MPEKLGNGGHGREEYDPNTGKYVADGQPNKVYNNPEENGSIGRETTLKKPINKMTHDEILTEIKESAEKLKKFNIVPDTRLFNEFPKFSLGFVRQAVSLCEKYKIDPHLFNLVVGQEVWPNIVAEYAPSSIASCDLEINIYYSRDYIEKRFNGNLITMHNIFINKNKVSSDYDVLPLIKDGVSKGWINDSNDDFCYEYFASHELGHVLSFNLINELYKKGEELFDRKANYSLDGISGYYQKFYDEIFSVYKEQNPGSEEKDFANDCSDYSKTHIVEWFAETFASMNGGKPTKVALAMKEWLDRRFSDNIGGDF